MLRWALIFLVLALVAGALGAGGVAGLSMNIAYVLFVIFIILLIVHFVTGRGDEVGVAGDRTIGKVGGGGLQIFLAGEGDAHDHPAYGRSRRSGPPPKARMKKAVVG
jgi:uncharacterized membrane protein YtjA (UPF0391 family)